MVFVIVRDFSGSPARLVDSAKRIQAGARWYRVAEGCVLDEDRPAGREIAHAAVADPTTTRRHVCALRHRQLRARAEDVRAERVGRRGNILRMDETPSVR